MESGSLAQWLSIAVALLSSMFGLWKWLDHKLDEVYKTRSQARSEVEQQITLVRSEALAQAARADQQAATALREVAKLELEMVKRTSEYITKNDLDRALDRIFNPFFLRIDTLEKKLERYIDAKMRS